MFEDADRLRLIQQWSAGIEGVDIQAAGKLNIPLANVPTSIGNADAVAELVTHEQNNIRKRSFKNGFKKYPF